jgi:hypothetical protein
VLITFSKKEEKEGEEEEEYEMLRGRLHGAVLMCVFMSGKPFDAEACDIGGQASATNGSPDMKTHIENAACNRPLTQ